MSGFEVAEPILSSPYEAPEEHWRIVEGETPRKVPGRRPAMYYYRSPTSGDDAEGAGIAVELKLVNLIRSRLAGWRNEGYPGVTRTTLELLQYWRRDGRRQPLFFAQLEAAETIILLTEGRADLLQGLVVPTDEPSPERVAEGYRAFRRLACKMATGTGKTTVMAMLAAWSILNKTANRGDARFSDAVLVVCPNVTIRRRLDELSPGAGEASLYRTRDLAPPHLMPELSKGRVLVTNWHVFEPQGVKAGGDSAKVLKVGVEVRTPETIVIGDRTTTARGRRYLTEEALDRLVGVGLVEVGKEHRDGKGRLKKVEAVSVRYVESDAAMVNRVLGRDLGSKQNILVLNDEAHHAYRIRRQEPDSTEDDLFGDEEEGEEFVKEATVWVEGLDRIHRLRGVNLCVDLSATPYFLARVGQDTNRVFPWVVSDFGLTDAIESGLVKIPQLAVRDTTGAEIPGYFNIWRWIMPQLTSAERGGRKGSPKPEAILKWANPPISMLAGLWQELLAEWQAHREDPRPPVFIVVCKNTRIAGVVYDWLGGNRPPPGIPSSGVEGLRNRPGRQVTIRVDSKVVHETDTGEAKSDESAWMRLTLDTVGRVEWPADRVGRPIYPGGFKELAAKLGRPLHPPGRDVRCIVSVGMLTEGWDCTTVTHVVGLRPFMSQLLCEQVVGRALRRTSYDVDAEGRLKEEVAKIFGVPFEVVPFKANPAGPAPPPVRRFHVHALPERAELEITFPRLEGYRQVIRNRVTVSWETVAALDLDPQRIPPEVEMKGSLPSNTGRPSLAGPGRLVSVTLNPFRSGRRLQELVFELARDLTRELAGQAECTAPAHVLFPQLVGIVHRYLDEKVRPHRPAETLDVFLSPYYGWVIERLREAIQPDVSLGEAGELPRYELNRGPGSTAEVDLWTSRDVREVLKSHVNYVVADTRVWEQSAAYLLDTHPRVQSFVKNAGLGFAIPYLHNDQPHDYVPDFIVRLDAASPLHLILETKGFDPLAEVKAQAAERWERAVNLEGSHGQWRYAVARKVEDVSRILDDVRE